ncbi:MAG: NUDIX hydrolase [Clostridia bacterium]|nr:NUDIX hydrolase [Clostridia bacterium]
MKLTEKIMDSKTHFQGKIINVRVDTVELENGATSTREIVEHPGGVCVIGIDNDGKILMVRQFRSPFGRPLLEVPAGKLNYGEDHFECGKREFLEETGYEAEEYIYFGELYPSVGFLTEKLHIYYAKGLIKKEQHLDENEFLNVERYTLAELMDMVEQNQIKDAKTVVAILRLQNYLAKQ